MARPKAIELRLEGKKLVVVRLTERAEGGFTREVLIASGESLQLEAKPEKHNPGLLRIKLSSQKRIKLILDVSQRLEIAGVNGGDTMILSAAPDGAPSVEIIS